MLVFFICTSLQTQQWLNPIYPLTYPLIPPNTCIYRDLERIEAPVYSVKAHEQIVNGIDGIGGLGIGGGAPELVTGSRDGEVVKLAGLQSNFFLLNTSYPSTFPSSPPPPLLFTRKCKGLGSSSKGQAGSLHGACRGRDEKRLLDSSFR